MIVSVPGCSLVSIQNTLYVVMYYEKLFIITTSILSDT